jgi:hypothetical protein
MNVTLSGSTRYVFPRDRNLELSARDHDGGAAPMELNVKDTLLRICATGLLLLSPAIASRATPQLPLSHLVNLSRSMVALLTCHGVTSNSTVVAVGSPDDMFRRCIKAGVFM